jgi:hypothetical protein
MNDVTENANGMNRVAQYTREEAHDVEYMWKDTRGVEFA